MNRIKAFTSHFAKPELIAVCLIWLMILLVSGTLAQRTIGLYMSQQTYFSSWYLTVGPIPLPGGYATMFVIFMGLVSKLLFHTRWCKQQLGINIVHSGACLLLLGGFVTAMWSEEGSMVIPEGEETNQITDYYNVELAFDEINLPKQTSPITFSQSILKEETRLLSKAIPFAVQVLRFCSNVDITRREIPTPEDHHGFAKIFDLSCVPHNKEEEKNRAGIIFRVSESNADADGIYAVFEEMQVDQTIRLQDKTFRVHVSPAQTHLPFFLKLIDFEKKTYAATDKAKSYRSVVLLKDGDIEERHVIEVNEPLRYKDYTFYQASFVEGIDSQTTVLAVVKNAGRVFPYLASIILCVGLLIHLMLQIPKLIRETT